MTAHASQAMLEAARPISSVIALAKLGVFLAGTIFAMFVVTEAGASGKQMRLLDELDYPGEGYCIDVLGVEQTARTDLPLVLHNCLPSRNSADRQVVEQDGRIYLPAYDACLTAFGVRNVLPGVPVILRRCGRDESFLPVDKFQQFERTSQNQLQLVGTALCLAAGNASQRTFNALHRWRTLSLQPCAATPLSRSAWQ